MSLYISFQDVRIRLSGKVRFDLNPGAEDDENKMSVQLALQLINQAEGDVELDLSPRYYAPFSTDSGAAFAFLPDRPTKQLIRSLCLIKAAIYILNTDFGKGSAVDAENYTKNIEKQYEKITNRLMARLKDGTGTIYRQWVYPPLPGLALAPHNSTSDDGYAGQIYVTGSGEGAYAGNAVNDPGKTYWNATARDILQNEESFKFSPNPDCL